VPFRFKPGESLLYYCKLRIEIVSSLAIHLHIDDVADISQAVLTEEVTSLTLFTPQRTSVVIETLDRVVIDRVDDGCLGRRGGCAAECAGKSAQS